MSPITSAPAITADQILPDEIPVFAREPISDANVCDALRKERAPMLSMFTPIFLNVICVGLIRFLN